MTQVVVQIGEPEMSGQIADRIGLPLLPMHLGSSDPALAQWFYVTVPPGRDAEELARRLTMMPYVHAAYTKPPEAAP